MAELIGVKKTNGKQVVQRCRKVKHEFIWFSKEEWPQEFLISDCSAMLSSQMSCFSDQLN
jgi:hypothetical protein